MYANTFIKTLYQIQTTMAKPKSKKLETSKTKKIVHNVNKSTSSEEDLQRLEEIVNNTNKNISLLKDVFHEEIKTKQNFETTKEILKLKEEILQLNTVLKFYSLFTNTTVDKNKNSFFVKLNKNGKAVVELEIQDRKSSFVMKTKQSVLKDEIFENDIEFQPQYLNDLLRRLVYLTEDASASV